MSVDYANFLCTNIICVPFVVKESLMPLGCEVQEIRLHV